jgi:hypothetical protein
MLQFSETTSGGMFDDSTSIFWYVLPSILFIFIVTYNALWYNNHEQYNIGKLPSQEFKRLSFILVVPLLFLFMSMYIIQKFSTINSSALTTYKTHIANVIAFIKHLKTTTDQELANDWKDKLLPMLEKRIVNVHNLQTRNNITTYTSDTEKLVGYIKFSQQSVQNISPANMELLEIRRVWNNSKGFPETSTTPQKTPKTIITYESNSTSKPDWFTGLSANQQYILYSYMDTSAKAQTNTTKFIAKDVTDAIDQALKDYISRSTDYEILNDIVSRNNAYLTSKRINTTKLKNAFTYLQDISNGDPYDEIKSSIQIPQYYIFAYVVIVSYAILHTLYKKNQLMYHITTAGIVFLFVCTSIVVNFINNV